MKPLLRMIGLTRWLRLGVRRRIVGAFYPAAGGAAGAFAVPYHGIEYRGDIGVAQEWHVYFFGGYELKESALIEDLLGRMKAPVAYDIGANLGGHSFAMARHAQVVHAFEPYGPLADRIAGHADQGGVRNLELHRYGLGDTAAHQTYFLDEASNNSGTGSFKAEHAGADAVAELEIRRGDDCDLALPDFIKIDVEGFEAPALKGLAQTLNKARPVIMMEVTQSSWDTFDDYGGLDAILPFGHKIYEICNPKSVLGVFQSGSYRLQALDRIVPRRASFNVLLVPDERAATVAGLAR